MIITKQVGWGTVKNTVSQPELDYESLSKISNLKDMRKTSEDLSFARDFKDICKKSILPVPGFVDQEDDTSSEGYVPHSDWEGPSGDAWIGKGYDE
jgi:hypothetical protein